MLPSEQSAETESTIVLIVKFFTILFRGRSNIIFHLGGRGSMKSVTKEEKKGGGGGGMYLCTNITLSHFCPGKKLQLNSS